MYSRYFLQLLYCKILNLYFITAAVAQAPFLFFILLRLSYFSIPFATLRPGSKFSEMDGRDLVNWRGLWISLPCAILRGCFTSVTVK